ncbi:MAG: hypothetical protein E2590_12895 [Chryseobacterium sp.]|nr:hypothetical protein [Chryseobacterium sp.]
MIDLLIIYTDSEVISVSEYQEGTVVVTPYYYMKNTKEKALIMLNALEIEDLSKLQEFEL